MSLASRGEEKEGKNKKKNVLLPTFRRNTVVSRRAVYYIIPPE
jgi:hypothetical protein